MEIKYNVNEIKYDSTVDGPGVRTVIFFQGCAHNCVGCHNKELLKDVEKNLMTIEEIIREIKKNSINNKITFSGGDPMFQKNIEQLAKELKKEKFDIWMYTGYYLEEIKELNKEILKYVDVIVDGPFELDQKDLNLEFRGSKNQKINYINKREKK